MPRCYLPTTLPGLAAAREQGWIAVPETTVRAEDDSEDAEYDALMSAGDASAELLAGLPDGSRRRVVVVAEEALVSDRVALADVAAFHADDADDADPDDDLGWYATQELGDLLGAAEGD